MRLYFSTPVWGAGHIEFFKTIGLPSLLSRRNLPAIAEPANCRYFLYTRAEDVATLRDCDAFRRLARLIPVQIQTVPEPIVLPHTTMSWCHADTLRRADRDDVAAVFLPPDCVWADGSMARLQALADAGKSVVQMSGVRLDKDAAAPELRARLGDGGAALTIQPADLVELGLRHLHTIALSHFWSDHGGRMHPANLYWTVPGQGLVLRCFHLHPLLVKSQTKFAQFTSTIDDDLALIACPDPASEHVIVDSDEILAFELSSPSHKVGSPFAKNSVLSVAGWTEVGANARHRELVRHTIRLHAKPIDPKLWAPVEMQAEAVIAAARGLNARSTPRLALTNPKMFIWRSMAILMRKGLFSGRPGGNWDLARRTLRRVPGVRAMARKLMT
ncbi:MAG: hypothetical protein ABR970_06380 [Roseiarcus sp.]|jgi:hypothetical protein